MFRFSLKNSILIFFILSPVGCTHSLTLKSAPQGAEVFEVRENGEKEVRLGTTPLQLSSGGKALRIQKSGYMPSTFLLPKSGSGLSGDISITLFPLNADQLRKAILEIDPTLLNSSVTELFELQSAITEKRRSETDSLIRKMKDKYEHIAIFHILVGYDFYDKKDLKAARNSFLRAVSIDPKNNEALSMLSALGGRK